MGGGVGGYLWGGGQVIAELRFSMERFDNFYRSNLDGRAIRPIQGWTEAWGTVGEIFWRQCRWLRFPPRLPPTFRRLRQPPPPPPPVCVRVSVCGFWCLVLPTFIRVLRE